MTPFFFSLLLALPGGARAQTFLSERFARPGVIAAPGLASSDWETETGHLIAKGGTGYSDSRVLRLLTRRADIGDAAVSFQLLTPGFDAATPDDERPWDGVHVLLRYRDDGSFYDVGVNRRDNTVVVKKKAPAADGQTSTFYNVGAPAGYAVPLNTWQAVRVEIADQPGGSVAVRLYLDGALALNAVDDGSQGGAPLTAAGRVGLRGDNAAMHLADLDISGLGGAAAPSAASSAVLQASATVTAGLVQVSWRTPADADSSVDFGPTTAYGQTALGGFGREHAVTLPGLAPGTAYHYRVRSRGAGFAAESADGTFTPQAPLGVAGSSPTVTLTSPGMGQQLSGVVTLTAAASDGSGQCFVKFFVDGTPLGAEVPMAPYSLSVNTALIANGSHAISAVARNLAGLTSVVSSSVTVANGLSVQGAAGAAVQAVGTIQNVFTQPATAADPSAAVPAGAAGSGGGPPAVPGARASAAPAAAPSAPAAAAGSALAAVSAAADPVRAPERFLSPALADGINDLAHFGAQASEVSIYDIRGRRVYHALRQGGTLTWNGRDVAGRIVESGVYIARIIRGDGKAVYESLAVAK